jgi:hypothetical protein
VAKFYRLFETAEDAKKERERKRKKERKKVRRQRKREREREKERDKMSTGIVWNRDFLDCCGRERKRQFHFMARVCEKWVMTTRLLACMQ